MLARTRSGTRNLEGGPVSEKHDPASRSVFKAFGEGGSCVAVPHATVILGR